MDLHKKLPDHLATHAFTALGQLRRRLLRASLARQADLQTKVRVIVFHLEWTVCLLPY
jgi:hypothetical protein